jgi:hypothetical protein
MKLDHGLHSLAPRLGAVMFALALPAAAQFSFNSPVSYASGADPHDVALGDVDADGDLDLVTALHTPPRVSILRNDGNGVFGAFQLTALPPSVVPQGILAPDFDGDGLADLAVVSSATNELYVLHNLGDAVYVPVAQIPIGIGPTEMVVTDMDGDGDLDIAVSNTVGSTITILHNMGFTQFDAVQDVQVRTGPKALAAGLFFGDALPGLAVAVHDAHAVYVLRNDGSGRYGVQCVLTVPNATNPECVEVADFDNDGLEDIVASFSLGILNQFAVFYQFPTEPAGDVARWFSYPVVHNVGAVHPAHIVAGDFDLDTWTDVAIVSSGTSQLCFLRNTANLDFGFQVMMNLPGPASDHMALGDLDANYRADLVVTNDGGSSLSVILNAQADASNYCQAVPNSTLLPAHISMLGSSSLAANDFGLRVTNAPPFKTGLFLYGAYPELTPFKGSFLCLAPPLRRLQPGMFINGNGSVNYTLPLEPESVGHSPLFVAPGDVLNFQFIYRDTRDAGWPMTNFTEGLRVVFVP